jgi:hypothetical protein
MGSRDSSRNAKELKLPAIPTGSGVSADINVAKGMYTNARKNKVVVEDMMGKTVNFVKPHVIIVV